MLSTKQHDVVPLIVREGNLATAAGCGGEFRGGIAHLQFEFNGFAHNKSLNKHRFTKISTPRFIFFGWQAGGMRPELPRAVPNIQQTRNPGEKARPQQQIFQPYSILLLGPF